MIQTFISIVVWLISFKIYTIKRIIINSKLITIYVYLREQKNKLFTVALRLILMFNC